MNNKDVIVVNRVSKIYASERGPVHAIDRFSMRVAEGDFVAIVGPSGCGKTTLLWGLTGLHPFTAGKAYILGKSVGRPRREVGIFCPGETSFRISIFPLRS
jgi:NitT/TauT family transport system ATP-binding protein